MSSKAAQINVTKKFAIPATITGKDKNTHRLYTDLLNAVGPAKVVLIGEASHGTKEFYEERANITKALIEQKGFNTVIVEADFPDAYRANRYVQGFSKKDKTANEALSDFVRFPTWMWRNTVVLEFIEWLKVHNENKTPEEKAGFYGMDLYSFHSSARHVISFLENVDTKAAADAKKRYECFMQHGEDTQTFAMGAALGIFKTCEKEVLNTLVDIRKKADLYIKKGGMSTKDEVFYALMNAEVVRDAEEYYRIMMFGGPKSWNLRDQHMVKIIDLLLEHRSAPQTPAKVVVWAHNSHLGDARCTDMGSRRQELNVGQLCREKYGDYCYNIGFTTYTGTVSAASDWDYPREIFKVNPARNDSIEGLFHESGLPEFGLIFRQTLQEEGKELKKIKNEELVSALKPMMHQRYIGVIYRPDTELQSHYSKSSISEQFDAVIHIDTTSALPALDPVSHFLYEEEENVPETFPDGM